MKASDVMTKNVITAHPNMSVREAAIIIAHEKISGLPVVSENGGVLGIFSEADLIHRMELGTDGQPARWSGYFAHPEAMAEKFTKAHGMKVHDVMSRPVVSVEAEAELADVADTLDDRGLKRLPVMRDGKLVGIITRRDLVRALTRAAITSPISKPHGAALRKAIEQKMNALSWLDTSYLNMTVLDGVVRVSGYVQSEQHRDALRVLIEGTPGVAVVETSLTVGLPTLNWDGAFA
jgi:CBS domain-containing protein